MFCSRLDSLLRKRLNDLLSFHYGEVKEGFQICLLTKWDDPLWRDVDTDGFAYCKNVRSGHGEFEG